MTPPETLDAVIFIFYGNIDYWDWGSMNVDAFNLRAWARNLGVRLHNDTIYTNDHIEVTNETVVNTDSAFRLKFRDFLANSTEQHLIFTVSSHGAPYTYYDHETSNLH